MSRAADAKAALAKLEGADLERLKSQVKPSADVWQQYLRFLALKVAELDVLSSRTGRVPLLLLDDVSSELDRVRNERFFARLRRMGGQVFLTTTYPELIRLDEDRVDFAVDAGRITPG